MTFPSAPEELTETWLAEQLQQPVTGFRVETLGEGAGMIGQVRRVHLDGGTLPSIIAKFPATAPENRAVAATYDMYGREVNFYQNLVQDIDLQAPQCYFSAIDQDTQDFVILMEDIQGMRIGDQVAGCDAADAAKVIRRIARFHASTWDTDADLISHNNPGQRDGMIGGFQIGWPVVCEQFPEFVHDHADLIGRKMPEAVGPLLERMTQAPISLCHADVRLDNIFFGDDDITLVDWQSVCTSAPEQDLAYFVTQSLSTEVRQAEDWVAMYFQTLVQQGVSDYSLEACRERYRICALYLLCYAVVIAGTLDLANERGQALGRTLFGNAMQSLYEIDAFSLLETL